MEINHSVETSPPNLQVELPSSVTSKSALRSFGRLFPSGRDLAVWMSSVRDSLRFWMFLEHVDVHAERDAGDEVDEVAAVREELVRRVVVPLADAVHELGELEELEHAAHLQDLQKARQPRRVPRGRRAAVVDGDENVRERHGREEVDAGPGREVVLRDDVAALDDEPPLDDDPRLEGHQKVHEEDLRREFEGEPRPTSRGSLSRPMSQPTWLLRATISRSVRGRWWILPSFLPSSGPSASRPPMLE